uniref:Kinesin-like protein n=1 Tax=Panagrolaimus sp. PS1159 TaxID=55785 RepID=A0AC35GFM6_9BILA
MAQENVNVFARIRPSSNETNDEMCIKTDPISSIITLTTNQRQFHMDKIFEQNATQEEIFEYVHPIIAAVINGIHGTIFAYGQTGSGKTHTMIGSDENLGIIPRAIEMIFIALNEESKKRKDNFKSKISCTVLQVYNENTYDLLNEDKKIEIPTSDILKNTKKVEVNSSNECMKIIKCGLEQRKVSGTSMNETSSRSHAIVTLTMTTEYFKENKKHERVSRLNMVDLAGSESQRHTNNNKTQNLEGANINKSLFFLGQVIRDIINQKQFISYRSSKLTTILCDSLGGNSKTTVIANIHSNSEYAAETSSTLNFAVTVKKVKNTAILQEFITSKETLTLKAEVQRLGGENDKLKIELGKKQINQTIGEKVVHLQRIVDEKDNKINILEKKLKYAKDTIFQFENQKESFKLEKRNVKTSTSSFVDRTEVARDSHDFMSSPFSHSLNITTLDDGDLSRAVSCIKSKEFIGQSCENNPIEQIQINEAIRSVSVECVDDAVKEAPSDNFKDNNLNGNQQNDVFPTVFSASKRNSLNESNENPSPFDSSQRGDKEQNAVDNSYHDHTLNGDFGIDESELRDDNNAARNSVMNHSIVTLGDSTFGTITLNDSPVSTSGLNQTINISDTSSLPSTPAIPKRTSNRPKNPDKLFEDEEEESFMSEDDPDESVYHPRNEKTFAKYCNFDRSFSEFDGEIPSQAWESPHPGSTTRCDCKNYCLTDMCGCRKNGNPCNPYCHRTEDCLNH